MTPLLVGIMGPTASGKTELAEELAVRFNAQLINADAFQIYRGMDVGTAKPEHKEKYRLIDIRDPSVAYGVGEFVMLAQEALNECWAAGRSAVVVGGTGLYIRALMEEYTEMVGAPDPELRERLDGWSLEQLLKELMRLSPDTRERIDLGNRVRVQRAIERIYTPGPSQAVCLPPFNKRKYAVLRDAGDTAERIKRRVDRMVQNGWVQEVRELKAAGYSISDPGLRALGYKALWRHLEGEVTLEEAMATTIAETRQYSKRQRTWLRSEPHLVVLDVEDALEHATRDLYEHII